MSLKSEFNTMDKVSAKRLAGIERELTNNYRKTYKSMRSVFGEIYERYEVDGVLTYPEMQKYNRFKQMQGVLHDDLKEMYSINNKELTDSMNVEYKDQYFRSGYAIEKELQAKLSYIPLDEVRISAAIQNPIDGLTLDERFVRDRLNIESKINQEVTRGLVKGQSYGKTMQGIKTVLGQDASKAIRIANTETHRINSVGRLASFEHADKLGVDTKKVWVSTLDGKTRSAHQSLDGVAIGLDDDFNSSAGGSGKAPGLMGNAADDINCRCTIRVELAGIKPSFRRARGEGIVPQQTYTEWAKDHNI